MPRGRLHPHVDGEIRFIKYGATEEGLALVFEKEKSQNIGFSMSNYWYLQEDGRVMRQIFKSELLLRMDLEPLDDDSAES